MSNNALGTFVDQYGNVGASVTGTSANVAAGAAAASLPAVANKTNYVSGFTVTASGATAGLPVTVTLAGVISGTMNFTFTFPAGVLVGASPLVVNFVHPIPGSGVNTAITVTCPSSGSGGTNSTANIWGYVV